MATFSSCSCTGKAEMLRNGPRKFQGPFIKNTEIDRFRILGMTVLSGWNTTKKMMGSIFLLQAAEVVCWQER